MLNEKQQSVLDAICSNGGGIDVHEAMNQTGLTYTELLQTVYQLISKGYQIRGLEVGGSNPMFPGWIKRFFLSSYDPKHEILIKK